MRIKWHTSGFVEREHMDNKVRKKITMVNHYNVFTNNGGGAIYCKDFCKSLSKWFDINFVMISINNIETDEFCLNDRVKAYSVSVADDEQFSKCKTMEGDGQLFYLINRLHYNSTAKDRLRRIVEDSDFVFVEHVYLWRFVSNACKGKYVIYQAHNVEADYCRMLWGDRKEYQGLLKDVVAIEEEACNQADMVFTITKEERNRFIEKYGICSQNQNRFVTLGASIEFDEIMFVTPSKRCDKKEIGFYIASATPTTEAVVRLCDSAARQNPDVDFIIAGTVCDRFRNSNLSPNLKMMGVISKQTKEKYLNECTFAINMVEDGAGINIKMFEYFAAGILTITSRHGARGIEVNDREHCVIVNNSDFLAIGDILKQISLKKREEITRNARNLLETKYSWDVLARDAIKNIVSLEYIKEQSCDETNIAWRDLNPDCYYEFQEPVYIRGAGIYGNRCYKNLIKQGVKVEGFVDKRTININIDGVEIDTFTPMEMVSRYRNEYVVVAMSNYRLVTNELLEEIPAEKIILYIADLFIPLKNGRKYCPKYIDYNKLQ